MKLCLAAALTILLATTSALAQSTTEPIRIGWSGPLSGNSAVLGIDSVEAVRMAVEERNATGGIGGRKIELVVEDDQYDTAKAVSAYSRLAAVPGMKAIFSMTYGGIFAVANRALRDEILVVDPLDCNEDIAALPASVFCLATQSESVAEVLGEHILRQNSGSVTIIYDEQNPFMTLVATKLAQLLSRAHKAVLEPYAKTSIDYQGVTSRIKNSKSVALVFLGHDELGTAMKFTRAQGISSPFYTVGTITSPAFQKLAGTAAENSFVAYWEAPKSAEYETFLQTFKRRTGRPPILELATIPSYDAANVVLEVLQASTSDGKESTFSDISAKLLAVKNYQGLSGLIRFDSDGAVRTIKERLYVFNHGSLKPLVP